jgi:YfiR/HmsC-like
MYLLLLNLNRKVFYQGIISSILLCLTLPLVAESRTVNKVAGKKALLNDRVKAAFILNIARYVEWPENRLHNEVRLCFLNKNPLGSAVNNIRNKHIKIHPLEIRTIPSLQLHNDCNILFLTQQQMIDIAAQLKNKTPAENKEKYSLLFTKDVLIIGDLSTKTTNTEKIEGVMVFLTRQKTRFGIEISRKVLTNSSLILSSELLKLSRID